MDLEVEGRIPVGRTKKTLHKVVETVEATHITSNPKSG